MAVENPNDLTIGQTIRFKTLNPHDNVIWTGKIAAVCSYEVACNFEDIDTIYQDIQRATQSSLAAKESLSYLILKILENETVVSTKVVALAFIDKSTLEVVETNTYKLFKVYDIDNSKAKDILTMIQAAGYVAEITSN